MGMITRVRGRLRSLHTLSKLDPKLQNEKIAETVCLLTVLLLLPYCCKGHAPLLLSLGGVWLVTYSCLVLPLLISANYKYPVRWIRHLTSTIPGWIKSLLQLILRMICCLIMEIHAMEQLFTNMNVIYAFLCQLLFLTMCEIAILGEPKPPDPNDQPGIVGLSALLFYSVFGYFIAKIKDICHSDWSRSTHIHYSISHYIKWILKIILEWAKAVAVVLCIKDKGISYQPDLLYTTLTFSYYICTERLFIDILIKSAGCLKLSIFDCMEHLYVPIFLNIYVIISGIGVAAYLSSSPQAMYALFASYFVIYLRLKDLYYNYIKELMLENQTYASFRNATENDLQKWDDICAVCLNSMRNALITPCNHLFHPVCLKQCLRTSLQCPLCKHDFIQ